MIVFRYLSKQVLVSMAAVSGVLLLITMSGRFIKYLSQSASGELAPELLFQIMGYRLPGFLELILPLGLFLGILLAYGRMYVESEMAVLSACAISNRRLLTYTMIPALLVAALVGLLSLKLSPTGAAKVEELFNKQDTLTEFDTLSAGRFQTLKSGERVTYAESLSDDKQTMGNVFISQWPKEKKPNASNSTQTSGPVVNVASSGVNYFSEKTGSRFLVLKNGTRYQGVPGTRNYRVIQYESYGVRVAEPEIRKHQRKKQAVPTAELFTSKKRVERAELQWRISLVILVPIVALLAFPLSKVNPRQGRFLKLLPAILLYLVYLLILAGARNALEKGKIPEELGLWWVHGLFLSIAILINYWDNLVRKLSHRRALKAGAS